MSETVRSTFLPTVHLVGRFMLSRESGDGRAWVMGDQVRGAFRIDIRHGRVWWSPGVWMLHGLRPRPAPEPGPGMRVVIRHRHHQDRRAMVDAWRHLRDTHRSVCFDYRIVGVDGVTRPVMVIAAVTPIGDGLIVEGLVQSQSLPGTNSWMPGRPEPDRRPTNRPGLTPLVLSGSAAKVVRRPAVQPGMASGRAVLV